MSFSHDQGDVRGVSHVLGDGSGGGGRVASAIFKVVRGASAMFKLMEGGEGRQPWEGGEGRQPCSS